MFTFSPPSNQHPILRAQETQQNKRKSGMSIRRVDLYDSGLGDVGNRLKVVLCDLEKLGNLVVHHDLLL